MVWLTTQFYSYGLLTLTHLYNKNCVLLHLMKLLKILLTNWVHLPGFYIVIYLSGLLFKALGLAWQGVSWDFILDNSFSSTYGLLFLYGRWLVIGFYTILIALDIICFVMLFKFSNVRVKEILTAEWILISIPFIYWAFKHQYWLWIMLCLAFLCTQQFRKSVINKVLNLDS